MEFQLITTNEYESYKAKNIAAIKELLSGTGSRPVLFLGCGLARRYLGSPSWMELLEAVSSQSGIDKEKFNFLAQKPGNDPATLGTVLVDHIHEWAWTIGKNHFPEEYFSASTDKSIFLKYLAANHIKSFGYLPNNHPLMAEIDLLKRAAPHAVITTNFDNVAAELYPQFEKVIGERIITMSMSITGEIYQIHGTIEDPSTMVLTTEYYNRFINKRRYISSKMMTYFAEYPVFILGYGLGDINVNSIISDLGEAMKDKGGFIDNVYYIEWTHDVLSLTFLKEEHAVPVAEGTPPLRVRTIVTQDFGWISNAIADLSNPISMNTKALRHLAARVVDLVRKDIPKTNVEIDYSKIEKLSESPTELAMVFGISNVTNPNVEYPYCITQVAKIIGYSCWQHANKLLEAANKKVGYDIKLSDNEYHIKVKTGPGPSSFTRRYSKKMVALLQEIKKAGTLDD
jgi:hypothetical protein